MIFPHTLEYKIFDFDGKLVLFDVLTLQIFEITELIRDILELGKHMTQEELEKKLEQKYSSDEIQEVISELENLREQGFLTQNNKKVQQIEINLSSIFLTVVTGCNLACKYCCAEDGAYNQGFSYMDLEMAKKCIRFGMKMINNSERSLCLAYLGGEPLLNFKVIRDSYLYAIEEGKKQGISIAGSIATNATLVNEESARFLCTHFRSIEVTVDTPEKHFRVRRDGSSAWKSIIEGVELLKKFDMNNSLTITMVVTDEDAKYIERMYEFWREHGIKRASFATVRYSGPTDLNNLGLTGSNVSHFKPFLDQYVTDIKTKRIVTNVSNFGVDGLVSSTARYDGCSLGKKHINFGPDGSIYACYFSTGLKAFKMGNIVDGFDENMVKKFSGRHAGSFEKCKNCWARNSCGGGCPLVNYLRSGNIEEPNDKDCEVFKEVVKMKVYFAYKMLGDAE